MAAAKEPAVTPKPEPETLAAIEAAATRPTGPHVYAAIAAVMGALSKDGITKDRKASGGGANYAFRGVDDVYNTLSSILAEQRLCIIPRVLSRECVERTSKNGGALFYTAVDVEFDLVSAIDGSSHTARTSGEAMDSSDKSTNKAMSAAYKYMAFQTFCIPTEADNDADASGHEVVAASQRPAGTPKPTERERIDAAKAMLDACDHKRDLINFNADTAGKFDDLSDAGYKEIARLYAEAKKRVTEAQKEPV